MTRVPVQQTRAGLCLPDVRAEDALRATFKERSCVTLPRFLGRGVRTALDHQGAGAGTRTSRYGRLGVKIAGRGSSLQFQHGARFDTHVAFVLRFCV